MTEKIGQLWQEGETLVKAGSVHDGIIYFLKAKYLLNNEKLILSNAASSNNRTSDIISTLFAKLDESIEKNATILEKNPILALRLPLRFTKGDLKKCYRKSALKYHPDKNNDCDTSRLFTVIQSAYEKLEPIAPDGPANINTNDEKETSSNATNKKTTKSYEGCYKSTSEQQQQQQQDENKRKEQQQEQRERQQQKRQEEENKRKEQQRQQQQQQDENKRKEQQQEQQQRQQEEENKRKEQQRNLKQKQQQYIPPSRYPDPSDMTTDALRDVVRKFGVRTYFSHL
jgi:hypothetical protein